MHLSHNMTIDNGVRILIQSICTPFLNELSQLGIYQYIHLLTFISGIMIWNMSKMSIGLPITLETLCKYTIMFIVEQLRYDTNYAIDMIITFLYFYSLIVVEIFYGRWSLQLMIIISVIYIHLTKPL